MKLKNLGKPTEYLDRYSPELLEAVPRQAHRLDLFRGGDLPFVGADIWTAWELSWLEPSGKPQVGIAEIEIDCISQNICESKSLKLYLNSLNQTQFESAQAVSECVQTDLQNLVQGEVRFSFLRKNFRNSHSSFTGICVDKLSAEDFIYTLEPKLLRTSKQRVVREQLFSHLLKTNCPVTNQPDWASIWVQYTGNRIIHESFLRYVVSYREHQDFHENCVEQIFNDIQQQCHAEELTVYARYTRRGGLDINPFRTTKKYQSLPKIFESRQ